MLKLENLTLRRDTHFALAIERLEVSVGERITVLGPSGCGKSTLLRLIAGLDAPHAGDIYIARQRVTKAPPHQRHVSLLAQDFGLWPHLTAQEHLAFTRTCGRSLKNEATDQELLTMVHLEHKRGSRPGNLSGGERQRLALARALARRPRLLLLDEPFSNVDQVLAAELETLLETIHAEWGLTRIQVRHWIHNAISGERFLVMEAGRVVQDGSWESLCEKPTREWTGRLVELAG
jgi:ABC-type Fe3+/spermidine/putrescine transport system ATPase subunit